jgi:hypothetical protein
LHGGPALREFRRADHCRSRRWRRSVKCGRWDKCGNFSLLCFCFA